MPFRTREEPGQFFSYHSRVSFHLAAGASESMTRRAATATVELARESALYEARPFRA